MIESALHSVLIRLHQKVYFYFLIAGHVKKQNQKSGWYSFIFCCIWDSVLRINYTWFHHGSCLSQPICGLAFIERSNVISSDLICYDFNLNNDVARTNFESILQSLSFHHVYSSIKRLSLVYGNILLSKKKQNFL